MIEHASIPVKDLAKAKAFYAAALAPLGYKLHMDFDDAAGFMEGGHTSFWIGENDKPQATHIAFRAPSKEAVDEFHKVALAAGAEDNGAPGYRDYSPGYYAAFVRDADGNNVEAVWFDPEKEKA
jgi:catechol 2,3-dioxygenase-like lactoylglutathione lyase family enzyme